MLFRSTPDNSNETPLPPMPAVTQPPADLRAPGLYSSEDHTTLIKSWDQLISDGDIDTTRNFYDENNVLQYETGIWAKNVYLSGELVIANSVDSISAWKISSLNEYSVQIRLGSNLGGFFYFRKKEDAYGRKSGSDESR